MCGIIGFIGKSKNPRVSFDLMNALMVKTEIRGDHATGFWASETGDGSIFFDKEAVKSSLYIDRSIWKDDFAKTDCDLMLGHCRQSSAGVGHERVNKNNHPHASFDRNIALVHNGRINDYTSLKSRYETASDCDSEILLRMFESADQQLDKEEALKKEFPALSAQVALRLTGLREIFARVNYGHMAVAIGERDPNGSRYLWLFRNDDRPLHVIDMRTTLGQIFFCSEADIWEGSVSATPSVKDYIPSDQRIIIFPSLYIWCLIYNPNNEVKPWLVKKFKISKQRLYGDVTESEKEDDKRHFKILEKKPCAKIISRLDKDEDVIDDKLLLPVKAKTTPITTVDICSEISMVPDLDPPKKKTEPYELSAADIEAAASIKATDFPFGKLSVETLTGDLNMDSYQDEVRRIKETVSDIEQQVQNMISEGSINQDKLDTLVDSLKTTRVSLEGDKILLDG